MSRFLPKLSGWTFIEPQETEEEVAFTEKSNVSQPLLDTIGVDLCNTLSAEFDFSTSQAVKKTTIMLLKQLKSNHPSFSALSYGQIVSMLVDELETIELLGTAPVEKFPFTQAIFNQIATIILDRTAQNSNIEFAIVSCSNGEKSGVAVGNFQPDDRFPCGMGYSPPGRDDGDLKAAFFQGPIGDHFLIVALLYLTWRMTRVTGNFVDTKLTSVVASLGKFNALAVKDRVSAVEELQHVLVGMTDAVRESISIPPTLWPDESLLQCFPSHARGLGNLGNTCYMNAIIQALVSFPEYIDVVQPVSTLTRSFYCVAQRLTHFFDSPVIPVRLKQAIDTVLPQYSGFQMHDAPLFFLDFVNAIDKEIDASVREKERVSELKLTATLPSEAFAFTFKKTFKCLSCGKVSSVTEKTLSWTLPIIHDDLDDDAVSSVELCLQEDFTPRTVRKTCTKCLRGVRARQSTILLSRPKVLVLHLIRFRVEKVEIENESPNRQGKRVAYTSEKIVAPVETNELLSLTPFFEVLDEQDDDEMVDEYSLCAIVHHLHDKGTNSADTGHYTVDAKRQNQWWSFDDSVSEPTSIDALRAGASYASTSYLVMYELQDNGSHGGAVSGRSADPKPIRRDLGNSSAERPQNPFRQVRWDINEDRSNVPTIQLSISEDSDDTGYEPSYEELLTAKKMYKQKSKNLQSDLDSARKQLVTAEEMNKDLVVTNRNQSETNKNQSTASVIQAKTIDEQTELMGTEAAEHREERKGLLEYLEKKEERHKNEMEKKEARHKEESKVLLDAVSSMSIHPTATPVAERGRHVSPASHRRGRQVSPPSHPRGHQVPPSSRRRGRRASASPQRSSPETNWGRHRGVSSPPKPRRVRIDKLKVTENEDLRYWVIEELKLHGVEATEEERKKFLKLKQRLKKLFGDSFTPLTDHDWSKYSK